MVELIGDGIKFTYTRGSQTPKEAVPILRQFKERKQEVVNYLQEQSRPEPQKPEKPTTRQYELTERDYEIERYIGKPDLNPNKYPCARCGTIAGRYCLGQNLDGKWWWAWWCLRCRPYTEPERN